jgi:hypothetical protein
MCLKFFLLKIRREDFVANWTDLFPRAWRVCHRLLYLLLLGLQLLRVELDHLWKLARLQRVGLAALAWLARHELRVWTPTTLHAALRAPFLSVFVFLALASSHF